MQTNIYVKCKNQNKWIFFKKKFRRLDFVMSLKQDKKTSLTHTASVVIKVTNILREDKTHHNHTVGQGNIL